MNGDLVKRSLTAVESAMVIGVETEVQLDHVLGIFKIDGWTPTEKVRNAMNIEARSRVVYDNWVGVVEEVRCAEAGRLSRMARSIHTDRHRSSRQDRWSSKGVRYIGSEGVEGCLRSADASA